MNKRLDAKYENVTQFLVSDGVTVKPREGIGKLILEAYKAEDTPPSYGCSLIVCQLRGFHGSWSWEDSKGAQT